MLTHNADPERDVAAASVTRYLEAHEAKSLLRFITCGSVDDGKSTLIGRLLYDARAVLSDQLAALEKDSQSTGTQGGSIDFALLVDGLAAEREQGITIDVAYRYFTTEKRKFIVADTPGHEQYTRNMVTGASTADLAIILVDARKGLLTQTRRHAFLCRLLGVREFVLAVNKMDLVEFSEQAFVSIERAFRDLSRTLDIERFTAIPVSGLTGENIVESSPAMPWYSGATLLGHLEGVEIEQAGPARKLFRMPVQWVNRPNQDFRGYSGLITSGEVRPGDLVCVNPSGRTSAVQRIVTYDGDLSLACAGQSVTLTLDDEVDCSRGDLLSAAADRPGVADEFEAVLIWMNDQELLPGRPYWLQIGATNVTAQVHEIKYEVDVNTHQHIATKTLKLNAIGVVTLGTDSPIVFEPYETSRALGGFLLVDKFTNTTVAAGLIRFSLRRSDNIHPQPLTVSRESLAALKSQSPRVLWFTGLSGAGKSTIANLVQRKLHRMNRHTVLLDGDNVRHGLNRDLGFTDADRVENIRRVAEVARLMADAGLIVLTAFISPFRAERRLARALMSPGEFVEIFVDTSLEVAEARDVKGLYGKARSGLLTHFTGVDSPYEPPEHAEIVLRTDELTADQAANLVVDYVLGPL